MTQPTAKTAHARILGRIEREFKAILQENRFGRVNISCEEMSELFEEFKERDEEVRRLKEQNERLRVMAELETVKSLREKNGQLEDLAAKALIALERCYSDAIHFLNEGDFKRHVEWDAGYIVDAIADLKERGRE